MGAQVFAFEHGGFRFAVPHARVRRVLAAPPEGADTCALVSGVSADAPGETYLELDAGPRSPVVAVRAPELVELDEARPLSAVLRESMPLAHVVGWGEIGGRIVWLVDPARL